MSDYSDAGVIAGLEKLLEEADKREKDLVRRLELAEERLARVRNFRDKLRVRNMDLVAERSDALLWVPEEEKVGLMALWQHKRIQRDRNREQIAKEYAEERAGNEPS